MRFFQPLRDRRVALLFTGQALSCIGDEIYNVAVVWMAVTLVGESAGYLSAMQAAAVLVFSLFAGVWTDQREQRKVLIFADIVRGIVVLIPVALSYVTAMSMAILVPVAFVVASFSGIFHPAMRSIVPDIVTERKMLSATNALIESTVRFGRAIGPNVVAFLGTWLSPIHFFSINALTFFASAIALKRMGSVEAPKQKQVGWQTVKEGVLGGARMTFQYPPLRFIALTGILSTPTWYLILPLGLALLVHERMPDDYAALGLMIGSYGIGNVLGNIWVGSVEMKRPERFLMAGRLIAGLGFIVMALTPSLAGMLVMAGVAACGGPITDLANVMTVQNKYRGVQAARVFRFQLAFFNAQILVIYLLSPFLFRTFGVVNVILGSASLIALAGMMGFWQRTESPETTSRPSS